MPQDHRRLALLRDGRVRQRQTEENRTGEKPRVHQEVRFAQETHFEKTRRNVERQHQFGQETLLQQVEQSLEELAPGPDSSIQVLQKNKNKRRTHHGELDLARGLFSADDGDTQVAAVGTERQRTQFDRGASR